LKNNPVQHAKPKEHLRTGGIADMNRLHRLVTAAALTLTLSMSLPGCMAKRQPQQAPEPKQEQGSKKGAAKKPKDPIVTGVDQMKSELGDLRDALKAGDTNEVTKQARELDDAWGRFEQKVATKNAELHDQIETSLNAILAGVQVAPGSTKAVESEIDKLDQKLDTLKQTRGEPPTLKQVDMKTGAAAMRYGLSELKKAVETGDTAKMQEQAKAVDRAWKQFKAEVKQKRKQQYEAIEDSMHALLAEVKKSPVDKEKLKQQTDKLDGQLAELTK
jgi:iron uptake system EfeUOB component EfeO/EfeM